MLCRELLVFAVDNPKAIGLISQLLEVFNPCRHGVDFASILWHSKRYSFTPAQAACIRLLWEAWESGVHDVRQETMSETANGDSSLLKNIFRGHPAWGSLVVPGESKGTFRLLDPAAN